ncbi:efflux RND transporter permease subunit [Anatilimnocola sp. NA78]|uniref:efflux RND transporter permease subunit n=1 Tax=Anatilimnocola sp. NA78 TaxID=3415683 RepID=UPI003CE45C6C
MFSRFFIDRPIFATVLSIVVTLAGGIAVFALPVTQYPEITPPTVEVSTVYPGANAQVVADTVASPIEQQVNGVEGMLYMSSQSTNDGVYSLTVTFRPGSDLNLAQVLVQNRVALAQPILPDLVKRRGVTVKKKSPSTLMIINLSSPDKSRDNLYLSNYATIQLRDELSRLPGVGDISFMGQRDYSMRVWLDPERLAVRNLDAADVVHAIEQQNTQVAAGQVGQPPAPTGQAFQYTMTTLGRLAEAEDFGDMIIRTESGGRVVRLRDVARTELGALAYDQICTLDGQPSVALSIYQLPGSNALETARQVRAKMDELKERFPAGVTYDIVYDTTPFIQESVNEVFTALRDAVILVALVVLVFLQGWRAAIIPLVAVPVAIIGTFAAMVAVGFSLNTLTLFGLVLAVGIVVDDAIVVVEAVEHHIERGLAPRDAAIKAMEQVSGPVIAVGLVLTAVFIPCAFISGIVGQFFRQFALTIAISTVISAFNSLTLSPALAVLLLKPKSSGHGEALPRVGLIAVAAWAAGEFLGPYAERLLGNWLVGWPLSTSWLAWLAVVLPTMVIVWFAAHAINRFLSWFFKVFNVGFNWLTEGYVASVGWLLRGSVIVLLIYGGLLFVTYRVFQDTPTGFIPSQDKGYLLVNVRLPDSASLERTSAVLANLEKLSAEIPGVNHTVAIAGQSILLGAGSPNFGSIYVMLEDFHHRVGHNQSANDIAAQLQNLYARRENDAVVNVVGAPPIDGLGTAGGFKIVIEDRGGNGLAALQNASQQIVDEGSRTPGLDKLFTSFRADTTWQYLDIDRDAAETMGVSMASVFNMLQMNLGTLYINDFNRFGRTWQVNVQADAQHRMQPSDLGKLYVKSERGKMVPLSSFAKIVPVSGPVMLNRYNLYPSATINADAAPGASSGQAIAALEKIARDNLVQSMKPEWTELALLQLDAGSTATFAFILAVVLVFLVLAAQYESWTLPLAVILVVPMCLLCSILGVIIAGMDINIFTQIGFVVLVGLACKNAILIVEFARARYEAGDDTYTATLEACRLRLRPIIMTSLAFIFGVVPLVLGQGAGAEMRRTLGTAVFAGMLGVTLFGIFLTPVFFYVIQWLADFRSRGRAPAAVSAPPAEHHEAT